LVRAAEDAGAHGGEEGAIRACSIRIRTEDELESEEEGGESDVEAARASKRDARGRSPRSTSGATRAW
jgi:hypothetical protein